MGERHPHGEVRTEIGDGRILKIVSDRVEKKNAFTPKLMTEPGGATRRRVRRLVRR